MRTLLSVSDQSDQQSQSGTGLMCSTSIKICMDLLASMVILSGQKVHLPLEINPGQKTHWLTILALAAVGGIGIF